MTIKEFAKYHAHMYDKPVEWSEAWYKSFTDALYDVLIREDVTEINLPHVGTLRKDYLFPKRIFNVSSQKYEEVPGRMTLAFTPSAKIKEKIRALPPNPDLARAAKKRRRLDSLPQKRLPDDFNENNTDEVIEDE